MFLASPEFDQTLGNEIALVILVSVVPVFVLLAFHGMFLWMGVLQGATLVVGEVVLFRITRRLSRWLQLLGMAAFWTIANAVLTASLFLIWHFVH